MPNHAALVLALEPDLRQAAILKRMIRDRVHAELVVVDSRDAAIAAVDARVPDVILFTALLSPRDEGEIIAHLRTLANAEHVQSHTIPQLASSSQVCPLPDGVDVVVEGAPAHAFYVVVEGGVVVHREGEVLAHLGAGHCFGERGLLDNAPRNATVTTEVASRILRLEGDVLLEALQSSATLVSALDRATAGRTTHAPVASEATPFVDDTTWVGP